MSNFNTLTSKYRTNMYWINIAKAAQTIQRDTNINTYILSYIMYIYETHSRVYDVGLSSYLLSYERTGFPNTFRLCLRKRQCVCCRCRKNTPRLVLAGFCRTNMYFNKGMNCRRVNSLSKVRNATTKFAFKNFEDKGSQR